MHGSEAKCTHSECKQHMEIVNTSAEGASLGQQYLGLRIAACIIYLVQKETQCFYLQFLGLKIIDFKNCFNSVVLPSNKDLDCIVSS